MNYSFSLSLLPFSLHFLPPFLLCLSSTLLLIYPPSIPHHSLSILIWCKPSLSLAIMLLELNFLLLNEAVLCRMSVQLTNLTVTIVDWLIVCDRWAVSSVMTRQNQIPTEDGSRVTLALIPLWDMCNHTNGLVKPLSHSHTLAYITNWLDIITHKA